jgi:hypothetical protein
MQGLLKLSLMFSFTLKKSLSAIHYDSCKLFVFIVFHNLWNLLSAILTFGNIISFCSIIS